MCARVLTQASVSDDSCPPSFPHKEGPELSFLRSLWFSGRAAALLN